MLRHKVPTGRIVPVDEGSSNVPFSGVSSTVLIKVELLDFNFPSPVFLQKIILRIQTGLLWRVVRGPERCDESHGGNIVLARHCPGYLKNFTIERVKAWWNHAREVKEADDLGNGEYSLNAPRNLSEDWPSLGWIKTGSVHDE